MDRLDLEFFQQELSEKSVNLLPDGTTCYAARYFASKNQAWYCVAAAAMSPLLIVMWVVGGLVTASLLSFAGVIGWLLAWHMVRYRRYERELRAGCHMQGVFLFAATKDVVVRFHHALGGDVEESFSRDTVLAVTVQSRCCQTCLVVDQPASPPIIIPASWLVDSPHVVKRAIDHHLSC